VVYVSLATPIWREEMKYVLALMLVALFMPSALLAQGEKEKCLRKAQTDFAKCQKTLPSNVKPKDPKNPTEVEKKGMLNYTKASKKCNDDASAAALACK
jgi:hypothetical protein